MGNKGQKEKKQKNFHKYQETLKKDPKILRSSINNEPNIIIVGAGVAGLTCAVRLLEYGFKYVVILEAQQRLGGRIHTLKFADNCIDLGAQWCHGQQDNAVYRMVHDLDVLDSSGNLYIAVDFVRSNGSKLQQKVVDELLNVLYTIFSGRHTDIYRFDGSLEDYLTFKFNRAMELPELAWIDKAVAREFFEAFKKMEGSESSANPSDMSASGYEEYIQCPGDYMLNWRDKGFMEFIRIMLNCDEEHPLGTLEDHILFSTIVEKLLWDEDDGTVTVKCNNQQNFTADHVVITVPLGVLKAQSQTMFIPPLPAEKRRAINHLGYGQIMKIFLEYQKGFWPENWKGFVPLWRESDLQEIRESVHPWVEFIYGFYRVDYQPRLLVGWMIGPQVADVEKLEDDSVMNGCIYVIDRFLKGWNVPDPTKIIKTTWSSDPFTRGGFSYRSLNTQRNSTGADELAQPVNIMALLPQRSHESMMTIRPMTVRPLLQFAGEATSKNYYATVHGAVESGIREANRLAGYYWKDL